MTYTLGACRKDVFRRGKVLFIETIPMEVAERKVRRLRRLCPGYFVDWHYFAGHAVFKKLRKPWWRRIW